MAGMFVKEVIDGWSKTGEIKTSFNSDDVKTLILQSLKNTARFNGLTTNKYTTMAHSYLVGCLAADLATIEGVTDSIRLNNIQLVGLLHDIGECIIGDMVYPLKKGVFGNEYKRLEVLENCFRKWACENIFEIKNFEYISKDAKKFVDNADSSMGIIELIGISTDGDFQMAHFFSRSFSHTDESFNNSFTKMLEYNLKINKENG